MREWHSNFWPYLSLGKSYLLELPSFRLNLAHPVRFNELKRQLSITATTLSRRLEEFIEVDLVSEKLCQRRENARRLVEDAFRLD